MKHSMVIFYGKWTKLVIWGLLSTVLTFSCQSKESKKKSFGIEGWSLGLSDTKLDIWYMNQIKKSVDCEHGECFLVTRWDSLRNRYLLWYDFNLLLVDYNNITVNYKKLNPEGGPLSYVLLDTAYGKYIYSTSLVFYLFDNELSMLYNSRDFLDALPPDRKSGDESYFIDYFKSTQSKKVLINYLQVEYEDDFYLHWIVEDDLIYLNDY